MTGIEIVGIGAAAIDFNWKAEKWPNLKEDLLAISSHRNFGGKVACQVTAASKIGSKAALIANLGDDEFGKMYLQYLRNNDVCTDFVTIIEEASTGVNQITTTKNGVMQCVSFEGATNLVDITDIQKAKGLLCEAKVFICQQDVAGEAIRYALQRFKGLTILNLDPNVFDLNLDMVKTAHVVCCDAIEAGGLLSRDRITTPKDCIEALGYLIEKGAVLAIITLGAIGTVYADCNLPLRCIHVPVQNITEVSLSSFNNSFIGAYAHLTINFPTHAMHQKVGGANELAARLIEIDAMERSNEKKTPNFNSKMNLQINLNKKCYAWNFLTVD